MAFFIGRDREARKAYGFDDVALVPGLLTINPNEIDVAWKIRDIKFDLPIIASAMDGVVDVKFAIEMGKLGGLAVLNLEGIQTRYDKPDEIIQQIVAAAPADATKIIQSIYKEPIKEELIGKRIREIKKAGVICAVSSIPKRAERFGQIAQEAGADIFVIQATVTTVHHVSSEYQEVNFAKICKELKIPVLIGNCVTYDVSLELMETGIDGLLVGIGPGSACTSRGVLGIGVPQITATVDCAAARDFYYKKTGRYVPIITDGGMSYSGDICKAFAAGTDAVMIGSSLARAIEAPGKGFHWGMATPDRYLPRGTRIQINTSGTLQEILLGPAKVDDGSQNLVGALKTSMASLGAKNIKEMQLVEIIIASDFKHEGKQFQKAQKIGMGK
ncbi:MAG: GuaB3 family IMP dehydrogenase-related protein [bacterium]|nr:GuaB3 family IMP dehydrogenase-related protein [bacterium]